MDTVTKFLGNFINRLYGGGMEMMGKYYSSYRGFVADNEDPENLGRLKLIIPQVIGNQIYDYWAFPKGVYSGPGYGMQIIPEKGDLVWVEFEGGCPEIPIWSFGHFGRKEKPSKDEDWKDIHCHIFRTPKGNLVKFNDTKNLIHIENTVGDVVEINEKGVSIVTKKKISLGTLNESKYKAVLGEENEEVLNDIENILSRLHAAMLKDVAQYTSKSLINTAKELPLLTVKVKGVKAKIKKILSKINTLD